MRRTGSSVALAVFMALANASTSLAACNTNHDVEKIGNCAKGVVSSNAKAFWWILLVVGLLFMAASRKASRAIATGAVLVLSGIAIYNPAGVGEMMSNFANSLV